MSMTIFANKQKLQNFFPDEDLTAGRKLTGGQQDGLTNRRPNGLDAPFLRGVRLFHLYGEYVSSTCL